MKFLFYILFITTLLVNKVYKLMMKNHQLNGKEQSLREPIMMDLLMSKVAIYNLIKIIS